MLSFLEYITEKLNVGDATTSYMKLLKKAGGVRKTEKAAVNEIIAFLSSELPYLGLQARRETEKFLTAISKFK